MEEPRFKSKINTNEIIANFSIFLFLGIAIYFRSINDDFGSRCFAGLLMFVFSIWIITRFKTFILHQNELIIRRTFLPLIFDKSYKINQISNVKFYFQTGKFGGNTICIYTIFINDYDSYLIKIKPEEREIFIKCLIDAGIKVDNAMPQKK